MRLLISLLAWFLRAVFTSRGDLALENLALRQQLAIYARLQKLRPMQARTLNGSTGPFARRL